jgi:parallel beta-helix repeat protein
MCCALLSVGLVATAGPLNPPVGPIEPTMKTLDSVEPRIVVNGLPGSASAAHVITEPGSYYLTGNVIGFFGGIGIHILSDDVTLDLNGYSVVGTPGSWIGIYVQNAPTYRVSISNGVIRGWGQAGLFASNSRQSLYTKLRSSDNGGDGVHVGDGSIVRDVQASGNGGRGIYVLSDAIVESCTASSNALAGIETGPTCVVRGVSAHSNGGDGVSVGNASTVLDSYSEANTGAAGVGTGNGIRAGTWSVIANCQTGINAAHGVQTDAFTNIRDSLSDGNGSDGFNVAQGARIDGCVSQGNADDGFQFTTGCRLTNNVARDNAYGFYDTGTANSATVLRDNTAAVNSNSGFYLVGSGTLVAGNTAYLNGTNFNLTLSDHQVGQIITALGTIGAVSPFANFAPVAAPLVTDGPDDGLKRLTFGTPEMDR